MRTHGVQSDESIHRGVLDEFDCDTAVPAAHVGVAVTDRIVTVAGTVRDDRDRMAALDAASRVEGVCVILDAITVGLRGTEGAADRAIADWLIEHFDATPEVPVGVALIVRNKVITIVGTVESAHDRQTVRRLAGYAPGVHWMRDDLTVGSSTRTSSRRATQIRHTRSVRTVTTV